MSDAEQLTVELRFESRKELPAPWEPTGLIVTEQLNEPYDMRVELMTYELAAEPSVLLGASVSLFIERGALVHEISGIVERVEEGATSEHDLFCTITVVPALRALAHRRNSRIFQDMKIPEILELVLAEGLSPYERSVNVDNLVGDYLPQEYTVQYRESDFDFVHRLMEEYGINYRFKSEDGVEVMYLSDSSASYEDLISLGNQDGLLPMRMRGGTPEMTEDARGFRRESKLRSTVARSMVFDWLSPDEPRTSESDVAAEFDIPNGATLEPEREDYDHEQPSATYGYRSAGLDTAEFDSQVALRRARHQRDAVRCWGVAVTTQMTAGTKFELLDHPQVDLLGRYYVVSVTHMAGVFAGAELADEAYVNKFQCVPEAVQWRPARQRRSPRISGMQTATVVGPAGEEIHTDEHGRIKVQFHWDREGEFDENTSCFIRVVQPWAGNGWGFVFLPRIGMEVAVTFIEGDPDRPVITGCLYNGANTPPYALPDDKTKSTIKSDSSPGGGGFNELRFEDSAGAEEIYIHAQKDFNEEVLNDHNTTVGANQTNTVEVDQEQTIHGNQTEVVDGNQDITVNSDQIIHVVGAVTETIDAGETRTVTSGVTEDITGGETRTITGDQSETITGSVTRTISADVTETITGGVTQTITGAMTQTITGGQTVTTPATYTLTAAGGVTINAPAGYKVIAPGGTTYVDSFFDSYGAKKLTAYGFTMGLTANKVDLVVNALSVVNMKVDMVGIKVDICNHKTSFCATEVKVTPNQVKSGIIGAYMYAQTLFM
ncbi:putative vgr related protein [Enhygromyxa salina]|uniref:Putative vgr related protein n=1 Tax=Enhygromyxa salina TaxID=215803 RepID=A0A0C1Z3V6_9BACT|nr:type VI secretion system tip protein TssI/VgrG [Enhygromyxa salina]KIG12359.1 putative vgr related protein [Enhygromyxa salina]